MSGLEKLLLDDIRASLIRKIETDFDGTPVEEAFATCLLKGTVDFGRDLLANRDLALSSNPSDTAALGFRSFATGLSDDDKDGLSNAVQRLLRRAPVISGTPMPFCMDSLSLAGVLLGIRSLNDKSLFADAAKWIDSCRQASSKGRGLGKWQETFLVHLAKCTGFQWPSNWIDIEIESVISLALRSIGIDNSRASNGDEIVECNALQQLQAGTSKDVQWGEAVIRLASLDWIRRTRPTTNLQNVSVSELCSLLQRVADSLQYWTWESQARTKSSKPRRWEIDHEYHVQNLLWTILAPIFPDLISEDYTVKIGRKQPRADLGIPSLRVIVEAKFWYGQHSSKKIIEEIAQDTGLYLVPGSRYDQLVPFIWDDGRRTEEHKGLVAALKQMDGVSDAIVMSRPGNMT
jgi:hypothetical protein